MRADRAQVERLLKTARGQIDGVLKMVDENRYCMDIANQLLACEAVLRRAHMTVLRAHLEGCVTDAVSAGDAQEKISEMVRWGRQLLRPCPMRALRREKQPGRKTNKSRSGMICVMPDFRMRDDAQA